ncbi:MAG: histidine-type phosphatase [Rhodanobacter sp.]|nr:histidine-type phosphatase [Rhodanobacter sp.]
MILLYRHGVRTPLPGEVQLDEAHGKPWPSWREPSSVLTPHGAAGVDRMARYDRQRLAAAGLFDSDACPTPSSVWLWANTDQRTIASAQAYAEGFAPGCRLPVGHLPQGTEDPLFHPVQAGAVTFDAPSAVRAIHAETGGPDAITAPAATDLAAMARVMGCTDGHASAICDRRNWHGALTVARDGRGLKLDGPIATTSGTAEVILMAYAEGKPLEQVGWGRTDAATRVQLSRLHGLLFDIHARPRYVAERTAAVLSRRLLELLDGPDAPKLAMLVGSDNNIVALASVLGVHFTMPSYGKDDPPIGGALGIAIWRKPGDARRHVQVFYQAQTLDQLRTLQPLDPAHPPATLELHPAACPSNASLCLLDDLRPALQKAAALAR